MSTEAQNVVTTAAEDEAKKHHVFNEGIIVIFVMLMLFMLFEAIKHKRHWKFGHEASFVCVVGMLVSFVYMKIGSEEFADIMTFNDDLFFYFVLPPIVFASGYNMYRKKFFANLKNIALFGILGTFVIFGIFSSLTIVTLKYADLN